MNKMKVEIEATCLKCETTVTEKIEVTYNQLVARAQFLPKGWVNFNFYGYSPLFPRTFTSRLYTSSQGYGILCKKCHESMMKVMEEWTKGIKIPEGKPQPMGNLSGQHGDPYNYPPPIEEY